MGFKVDTSFLRFLTMGALGVRRVAAELKTYGFQPIELERYCASNKIWATKVKRLRLPDLMCVQTGLRVEVRAKSDLKIRMSDAPKKPDRTWDAGCRDEDLVALIACKEGPDGLIPADEAVYFSVEALRESIAHSKLGPPKSPSEGAERDRTWPATIPTRPGRVLTVDREKLVVRMEGDDRAPRQQTYTLNGKHSYVRPGDHFAAGITMLAGAPREIVDVTQHVGQAYNPLEHIQAKNAVDRYAAVKALRFRDDLKRHALPAIERLLDSEPEIRVVLEAAGTAAFLDSDKGKERLGEILWSHDNTEMSMEATFLLAELDTEFAREQLLGAASANQLSGDERRQAAVWGLGKAGLASYLDLIPFIADAEENVAFHSIAGFSSDTPAAVIDELIKLLLSGDEQTAPAASEALRVIASAEAVRALAQAASSKAEHANWAVATLGRLPPSLVTDNVSNRALLERLRPLLLLAQNANWLATEKARTDIAFLLKQGL